MRKVAIVFSLLILAVLFSGCTSEQNTPNTSSGSPASGEATIVSSGPKVYKIGEKFMLGELSYTVNNIEQYEALGSEFLNKTTEGMFYIVEITIENNSNSEKNITPSNDFSVTDEKGRTYTPSIELAIYAQTMDYEAFAVIEKLPPGIPKTGVIVFEMPKETKGTMKIKPSWLSKEALVEFS